MSSPVFEASVADKVFPSDFVTSVTSQLAETGVNVFFTLYIAGKNIPANTFLSVLQGAGYGNAGSDWEDFLTEFMNQEVTDYQRYALTWSDSIMAEQIITSARVNEVLSLVSPSTDVTSIAPVSFLLNTTLKFPTFVSLPDISPKKFLVTYIFVVKNDSTGGATPGLG